MLGRFICPASRLGELAAFDDELFRPAPGFTVSVLGRGGSTESEFLAGLQADLAEVAACRERHAGRVVIDVLEVRLPAGESASRGALAGAVERTRSAGLSLFFETAPALAPMIRAAPFARPAGLKLRCGGLEASAFPSCEQIALALTACLSEGVPFKATAGLHHPFPRHDQGVQARMHGFVNVFAAGVVVHVRGIGADRVRAILEDDDAGHFTFDEGGLRLAGSERIDRGDRPGAPEGGVVVRQLQL